MRIDLFAGYRPTRVQAEYHKNARRYAAIIAGVRSGKSHAVAREFVRRVFVDGARLGPGVERTYWVCAPTYKLTGVSRDKLFDALRPHWSALVCEWRKSDERLRLAGGAVIDFRSTDVPQNLVGAGLHGLWLDEAARVQEEAWRDNLSTRFADTRGWALFSTSSLGRNWFWREIASRGDPHEDNYDEEFSFAAWRTVDNAEAAPGLAAELDRIRARTPPEIFRREYEASLDSFAGQVFTGWDPALHICDAEPPAAGVREMRYGVDWGYRNPGVVLCLAKDGDGVWWAVEERVESGRAIADWTQIALALVKSRGNGRFFCDPSRPDAIAEFRRAGLLASAGENAILPGLETIARALHPRDGRPGLRIHRRCRTLVAELAGLRWAGDAEVPVDEDDHTVDALRYALHSKISRTVFV